MPRTGYSDFDLRISKEGDHYAVEVLDSPDGPADAERFTLPFNPSDETFLLRLENAILRSAMQSRGGLESKEGKDLREFGEQIYNTLFQQTARVSSKFAKSLARIDERGESCEGMRVKLLIEPPELALLPWEYLYDQRDGYLCLRSRTPVIRFVRTGRLHRDLKVRGPLKILGMISNPRGDWPDLDVENERRRIERALAQLEREGRVSLRWVPGESEGDLLEMMREDSWHIFHFVGHGGMELSGTNDASPEGFILLRDDLGAPKRLAASKLKYLLDGGRFLRLVVLNCCEGARGNSRDAFASPGGALVRSVAPAVVAMQYPISDPAAIKLAKGFYSSIAAGLSLERSITEARKEMLTASNMEWGIPVLFTGAKTGPLVEPAAKLPLQTAETEVPTTSTPPPPQNDALLSNVEVIKPERPPDARSRARKVLQDLFGAEQGCACLNAQPETVGPP